MLYKNTCMRCKVKFHTQYLPLSLSLSLRSFNSLSALSSSSGLFTTNPAACDYDKQLVCYKYSTTSKYSANKNFGSEKMHKCLNIKLNATDFFIMP